MKSKASIYALWGLIVLLSACTSDSDLLNNRDNKEHPGIEADALNAYISLRTDGLQTRAEGGVEMPITSVIYFLLDGDKIVGSDDGKTGETGAPGQILSKVKDGLRVIAVVNASTTTTITLKQQASLTELRGVLLSSEDLNSLIKVSQPTAVSFEGVTGSPYNPDGNDPNYPSTSVKLEVNQVTSRVDLTQATLSYESADYRPEVKLISTQLLKTNTKGYLNAVYTAGGAFQSSGIVDTDKTLKEGETITIPAQQHLTFANDNDSESYRTALLITYQVGEEIKTYTCSIKREKGGSQFGVQAGKWYQIHLTLSIAAPNVDVNVGWEVEVMENRTSDIPDFK